jgi:hypothetical protein
MVGGIHLFMLAASSADALFSLSKTQAINCWGRGSTLSFQSNSIEALVTFTKCYLGLQDKEETKRLRLQWKSPEYTERKVQQIRNHANMIFFIKGTVRYDYVRSEILKLVTSNSHFDPINVVLLTPRLGNANF